MTEARKPGWQWWQKLALAAAVLLFTAVAVLIGCRKPWIEPLPGVRVAMTRPFVKESGLGPGSAYRLLLQAIEEPAEATTIRQARDEWDWSNRYGGGGWQNALTKLELHPWPDEPSSPVLEAPDPGPRSETDRVEEERRATAVARAKADLRAMGADPQDESGLRAMGSSLEDLLPPKPPPAAIRTSWTSGQCQDILRLRELYRPQIALLDRALAAPNPQVPTGDSIEFLLPYLAPVGVLGQWLAVSAQIRAGEGDHAGALQDLERLMGMGDIVSRGGALLGHVVCRHQGAFAADAAWWIARREGLPSPFLLQMARSFWDHADGAEPYVEAARAEALVFINIVPRAYRTGNFHDIFTWGGPPSRSSRPTALLASSLGSTPRASTRNIQSCYQHLVAIAEKPYCAATEAEYAAFEARFPHWPFQFSLWDSLRVRDPLGYTLACQLFPVSCLGLGHAGAAVHDARLRGMALFLAIKAYEKERGALPERLAQLVPDYLPRVPKDPFDGKPFRYLRSGVPGLPPKAWAVYSIGGDFTDDGGKARNAGTTDDDRGPNPDLVWPSQPYPKPSEP